MSLSPALPNRFVAYGCLALSMSLVGVYVALSKPLAAALPIFLLAWLRFGIGTALMLPWLKKPADEAPMTRQTRWLLFLESFFGNFLFSICMLFGVSMTSAISAGVIMSAIPAVVALMSWVALREQVDGRTWAAIGFAALGIGLLAVAPSGGHGAATSGASPDASNSTSTVWLGNLLVFGAVLCEAAYAVIGKKLTGAVGPKRIAALINLWGFALVTPFGLYMAIGFSFSSVSAATWWLLLFYAIAASILTVWLWMTGLKTVPASRSGVFTVMLPVAAALTGVFALGERLSGLQLLAFALALAGVLLATLPVKPKAPR